MDSDLLLELQSLNQSLSKPHSSLTLDAANLPLNPQFLSLPQHQEPKKGIKNWKPIRMLSHIGKPEISCLFLVELIAITNLPPRMNGLRLSVGVRKKDSRSGAVLAMPSRVIQTSAQFQETLFIQCNVHCSGKQIKFEPRLFQISVFGVEDAKEVELGRTTVDLSRLIWESMEGSLAGERIRKWDSAVELAGKAEGGRLDFRVGFQIMDDGGIGIFNRVVDEGKLKTKGLFGFSSGRARRKSMNSFSVSTLDSRVLKNPVLERLNVEKFDFGDFQIVDKGIEKRSGSGEVVKEVVHNRVEKQSRLMELDSIADEIKQLESMMNSNTLILGKNSKGEEEMKELDANEKTLTREFLKLLDEDENQGEKSLLADLGNGLGPVIQTKDGGFMASMKMPKLVVQISKTFVLRDRRFSSGLEVFQTLAAVCVEELCSKLALMVGMDELFGKTAEQIAFEGIASAIVSGRNKEGASCSAAKAIGEVKRMILAMSEEKKRMSMKEDSVLIEEILAFSIERIEGMAIEALKIQADMAEEDAAFDASPLAGIDNPLQILESAISIDEEEKASDKNKRLTLLVIIQLRDPARQYEAVGAPVIALIQAIRVDDDSKDDEETRYKVISVHVGGLKVRSKEKINAWEGEKSKLTATQWLVANGMGKIVKKSKSPKSKLQHDLLWSLSSRLMENMWLRPIRNPDVKFAME